MGSITLLSILILSWLALISIPLAYSQEQGFLNYDGYFVGVKIDYPKDWVYNEYGGGLFSHDDKTVEFYPSSTINITDANQTFPVGFQIGKQQDLPYKNMPLDLYLEFVKNNQPSKGNKIVNVENMTFAGINAYKLRVDFNDGKVGFIILFNKNPDSYYITYTADKDLYDKYLPIINRMIGTFQFY